MQAGEERTGEKNDRETERTMNASKDRILVWFSCGAPSAVAAKLAIQDYGLTREVIVVNCDTKPSENTDNYRFFNEVETWIGQEIIEIRSEKYKDVDEVFEKTRYMSGVRGARCTTELKKIPRLQFALPDDIHVFGLASDERDRANDFERHNPDLNLSWILIHHHLTRQDCINEIVRAGIKVPLMYELGFDNNNCPGCVKASSPWYWDMIRTNFPEVFARRCRQSREIGCRLVEIHHHERMFLDELPPGPFEKRGEKISCGPDCSVQMPLFSPIKP